VSGDGSAFHSVVVCLCWLDQDQEDVGLFWLVKSSSRSIAAKGYEVVIGFSNGLTGGQSCMLGSGTHLDSY